MIVICLGVKSLFLSDILSNVLSYPTGFTPEFDKQTCRAFIKPVAH